MKNIIILGHKGFIGSKVFRYFKKNNKKKIFGFSSKNCNFIKLNIAKSKILPYIDKSVLIYCAGKHKIYGDNLKYYNFNLKCVKNILKICKEKKPLKLIFLSTVEVYGYPNKIINEKTKLKPISLYSKSKIEQEKIISKFCRINNIYFYILRLPGIYGFNDKNISIISKIVNSCKNKKPFYLYGSGYELRDYVYINDLVKIISNFVKREFESGIYNVVKGKSISLNLIINKIEKKFNKKINIIKIGKKKVFDLKFDNKKLKKLIKKLFFTDLFNSLNCYKIKKNIQ